MQFLEVADWLPDPLMLVRADGLLLASNRAAQQALGLTDDMMQVITLQDRSVVDADAVTSYLARCARSREPRPGVLVLRGPKDERLDFRASTGVFRPAADGQPARLLVRLQPRGGAQRAFRALNERIEQLSREVARRRAAEAARRKLEAQLLHAQKLESLGVLAGGIAHDFNNILTSIIGYCDLARNEVAEGSEAREYIEEVVNGAHQAAELTHQLLAYSGKGRFVVAPVSLTQIVERIGRLLQVSISKRCVLRLDLMPDQPVCLADSAQLRQVVMNLIINASDAIGDRSGVISVTTGAAWCDADYLATAFSGDGLPPGMYVTLEVSDTGSGMSAETQARIFDPFFTTKFTGRGLGLAAVLGIVRGHNGAIRVYSEQGRGTTFKLLFPAAVDQVAPDEEGPADAVDVDPNLVIVADDEERVRAVARHLLERMGHDVLLASDGREAVALFEAHRARDPLLLMDMTMPHLDGPGALREVHRLDSAARVLMMSGHSEQAAMSQCIGKGALGFIQKPFRQDALKRAITEALRERRRAVLP